ncbi:OmpA family protein [Terasakiella sp. A23]|uniref:OmpA family protein n=1 Tax=Terasakiella sp. FCG-A23 TaxID=3080561 RepID=UPI002955C4E7|nr:OmpA family protein [Terasakiella sp. A23]MDV7341299.1 OmpA family protein [Terasakiella sp. A23]
MADFRKVLMGSACALGLMITTQADAQVASLYDNNVMIDLSVLEDNGLNTSGPSAAMRTPQAVGKMPPLAMPKSTFHGLPSGVVSKRSGAAQMPVPGQEPTSRIVLRKPTMTAPAAPSLPSTRLAKTNDIKLKKPEAPKPMEKKAVVAKAAPKPMVKVAPKPTPVPKVAKITNTPAPKPVMAKAPEAPKPVAAPVKPVEVAKVEPVKAPTPPAPPAPKKMEKRTPPPAPAAPAKVMAEAPPPPPPSAIEPKKVASAMKSETKDKPPTQTSALPSVSEATVRVTFKSGASQLPESSKDSLKMLADELLARPGDRVQLLAYAGGEDVSSSKARRLSLSRALAVRSHLRDLGIKSTRIDVRALGNKTNEEPFDRVDVQITP